jgi:hypothetical protein
MNRILILSLFERDLRATRSLCPEGKPASPAFRAMLKSRKQALRYAPAFASRKLEPETADYNDVF